MKSWFGEKREDGIEGWAPKFDQENRRKEKELICFYGKKMDRREETGREALKR